MEKLSLDPEAFVEQLPPGTKAAVAALKALQEKVRRDRMRMHTHAAAGQSQ